MNSIMTPNSGWTVSARAVCLVCGFMFSATALAAPPAERGNGKGRHKVKEPVEETEPAPQPDPAGVGGIWLSPEEVRELPACGAAFKALSKLAREPLGTPNLSDQDDRDNVRVLARALFAVRTGSDDARREVVWALERIRGTESGARVLAVGREITAYVIAADLIGYRTPEFEDWLRSVATGSFDGRTLRSTHERRPNNWGTHAGAARIAIAAYLDDTAEIEAAAHVFRGWVGEAGGWRSFKFGDLWWHPEMSPFVGINPRGAEKEGHSIDGVLPDDQRRGGPFQWPPPKENYVYEGLQGAIVQAALLERLGYNAWSWGHRALLRAFQWLHTQADFPAVGDDTWQPHLVNAVYGTQFPAPIPSRPGKTMGFTDWTHGGPHACSER